MLDIIRGLVRPITTLTLVGALIYFTEVGTIDPEIVGTATVAALGFWFGGRTSGGS